MRPDYHDLDKWATTPSALNECRRLDLMSVEERLDVCLLLLLLLLFVLLFERRLVIL
jgi:hypothetical protein